MSNKNRIILKQMVRLSTILADLISAKRSINKVQEQAAYFIVQGESSNFLEVRLKAAEADCLCLAQYLRLSVSNWMVLILVEWIRSSISVVMKYEIDAQLFVEVLKK